MGDATEPTDAQISAAGRALEGRRGFRQLLDEMTFLDSRADADVPDDEEWTPEQRDVLADVARAVLTA